MRFRETLPSAIIRLDAISTFWTSMRLRPPPPGGASMTEPMKFEIFTDYV
jgi:hypothetical protein